MKRLTENELNQIVSGAAFLGSGGGGSIKAGKSFVKSIAANGGVQLTDKPPKGYGCVVADIGANSAIEDSQITALVNAFELLDNYWYSVHGERFTCLYPGETGAENMLAPMALGSVKGLPVFDGDGGGRAVPELELCSFSANGIAPAPLAMANDGTDGIIGFAKNALDMDQLLRPMTGAPQFGNSASMAFFPASNEKLAKAAVKGSVSYAKTLGETLELLAKSSTKNDSDLLDQLNKRNGCIIVSGKVTLVQDSIEGAFDLGKVVISNDEEKENVTIYTQNESIIAYSSNNNTALAVAPHSLCYLKKGFESITNAELKANDDIALFCVEAKEEIMNEKILGGFGSALSDIGYAGKPGVTHHNLNWTPLGALIKSLV